ncbi:MAG: aldolase/citrate lyase family protein, partial [Pseudomonadota bacterium]
IAQIEDKEALDAIDAIAAVEGIDALFIGRMDLKADRKSGSLNVQGLWLEPRVKLGKDRLAKLEAELDRCARFAGLERVELGDHLTR